jgi:hypothetical protein
MKRLALTLVLTVGLAAAPGAAAKELEAGSLLLCGPDMCRSVDDSGTLRALGNALWGEPGAGPDTPAGPAAYYELRFGGNPGDLAAYLVPAAGMLAVQPNVRAGVGWIDTPEGARAGLEELARGLEPLAAPTLVRVDLDVGTVADPAPYLALLGPLPEGTYPSAKTPRVSLDLVTPEPGPWTPRGGHVQLSYAPQERAILGDAGWRRVPPELAALIDGDVAAGPVAEPAAVTPWPEPAAAPAAAAPAPAIAGEGGFPWGLVAVLAACGLALIVFFALRHRIGLTPSPLARRPR